jgi:pimeloyl-ACP methyl ester carboxylesterase
MPTINVDGLEMGYELRGEGPVVMLVAGTGAARGDWIPEAVDVLAERFTVLIYDHRGTGETGGTEGLYSTRQFAADALGLLAALDIGSAHVMGHSMGGRVAQWMALDEPSRIRTLVLASSGPGEFPGQFEDGRPMMRGIPLRCALTIAEHGYHAWVEHYIRESMLTQRFQAEHKERADALVRRALDDAPPVEDYLKHTIARQQHQTDERLSEITMPVLVVIGSEDQDVGGTGNHFAQSEYLANTLPNATFQILKGFQHGFYWEAPQETMGIIRDWLVVQDLELAGATI